MIRNIRALAALAALSLSAVACATPTGENANEVEETNQDLASRSASFETFQGLDGKYYFHLIAGNGQNVLRSQGYTALASAEKGIASVVANGVDARRFDVEAAENGDWYFDLKADNGETIGTSQLYATKYDADRGARAVQTLLTLGGPAAPVHAAPRVVRFELFVGLDHATYFRLRAGNGEIVLSSEGYASTSAAKDGIASVAANGTTTSSFEVFSTRDDAWGVRLVAGNGEIVARGETYATQSDADRAVARIAEILRGPVAVAE